jgi:putative cell wall-binding protein
MATGNGRLAIGVSVAARWGWAAAVVAFGMVVVTVGALPAQAAFAGRNGVIAYVDCTDGMTTIRTVNPDGSDVRLLVDAADEPAWSPDGQQLAFVRTVGGRPQVFVVRADGTGQRQVTGVEHGADQPAWTPDGRHLLFRRHFGDDLTGIWRINALDGTGLVQVVPAVDPDGRPTRAGGPATAGDGHIAYSALTDPVEWSERLFAVFTSRADGSGAVRLTPPETSRDFGAPDWSPDSRWIAVTAVYRHRPVFGAQYLMRSDGTEMRWFDSTGSSARWSPDGRHLAFFASGPFNFPPPPGLYTQTVDQASWRLVVLGCAVQPSWQPVHSDPGQVTRLAGRDRIETAIAVSQAAFPGGVQASAVVLTRADDFPDALAGTPLAAATQAALLLSAGNSLDPRTKAEIQRVLAPHATVYLLGGPAAMSTTLEQQLLALPVHVLRLAGADRYETAVAIAEHLAAPGTVLLATGRNFPDALAAGAAAHHQDGVVLLTDDTVMPAATAAYLARHRPSTVYAIGGQAARAAPTATALAGADRYDTARIVARTLFANPTTVGIASGATFPDALAGGLHSARLAGPLLLTGHTVLPVPTLTYLRDTPTITHAYLYGGTAAIGYGPSGTTGDLLTGR